MKTPEIFYDKKMNIYKDVLVEKHWSEYEDMELLYEQVDCDYYIATRGNVVNRQPSIGDRMQDFDRIDAVMPAREYDPNKEIKQWYYVEISDGTIYIVDQMEYYRLPNGEIESVYFRLSQKWK